MAGSAPSPTSSRALGVLFGLVVLLALVFLGQSWHASILDRYEFRQLQTALSTWWIAQEGWSLDYPLPLFGPPWSAPMEFPTYQVIVAALHHVTGLPLEPAGRLVGIGMLFACLPAVYDLLALAGLKPSRRLIVLAVVLTSPMYLFYARTFMIETTALCGAVWFLALLRRALDRPHWGWLAGATAVGTLAGLTKVTTFLVFGLPALALVIAALRQPAMSRRHSLTVGLVAAAVSLSVAWAWIAHGDAVKDANPFTGFLTSRELRGWNFGELALRFDLSFWIHLEENLVGYILAEGGIAVALLCAPFAPARCRWLAGIALLGFLSGPLVFANLYHIHDYYYTANALLLLAAAGLLLAAAWDDPRLPRGANWLALGLVLAFQLHAFYRGYQSHHRRPAPPPPALAAVIRDAVPADGVVLVYGADWNPLLPYYFQRRAVMVPGERENETAVLDEVLARLPPRRLAAMVVVGDKLRGRPDFLRERAARFGFAPEPAARDQTGELYLPAAGDPAARARLATALLPPADASFPTDLKTDLPVAADPAVFSPAPITVRSRYGVSLATLDGRPILNAHAPSELVFRPAPGVRHLRALAGLPDGAFAPGRDAITDGITIEVVAVTPGGTPQRLYFRRLDPANAPTDRGPQTIEVDLPQPFAGELLLRLGNGPAQNPTNDWAYWTGIELK